MQTHWNTAIHLDGHLYASSGRHEANAELRCVKLATGEVMWSEPNLTRSSLLYVDGHFVCQSEDGTLRLLRVNNQKYDPVAEWTLREKAGPDSFRERPLLRAPAWNAPILAHGLLYVRGMDRLACLEFLAKENRAASQTNE
jgi:outer membrane protein assembly factor BamB